MKIKGEFMNQTIVVNQRKLNYKIPIDILSFVSLIYAVLAEIASLFNYVDDKLTFGFISVALLIRLVVTLAPYVLLVLYISKFYKKSKADILVPIIFGLIAINLIIYFSPSNLLRSIAFLFAMFCALTGFSNKRLFIIAMACGLLFEFISIIETFRFILWYIESRYYLYIIDLSIRTLGTVALYIALLLFGLKNEIPSIISIAPKKARIGKMTPEQELRLLKEKLELDVITEEEYQDQRAEIISKL